MIIGQIDAIFQCSGCRNQVLFHGIAVTISAISYFQERGEFNVSKGMIREVKMNCMPRVC